jgi:hypothetical protein
VAASGGARFYSQTNILFHQASPILFIMNATMQSRTLSVMQSPALGMPARCCSCRPRVVARQRWQPLPMIAAGCMKQTATSSLRCSSTAQYQDSDRQVQTQSQQQSKRHTLDLSQLFGSAAGLWLLTELPAFAEETATDFSQGSFSASSYYVTLGLFLLSLPGIPPPLPPSSPGPGLTQLTFLHKPNVEV